MTSRAARPGDLDLLAAMNAGLIRDEGHTNPMDETALKARMTGWLEAATWRVDLFETDGAVVGCAAFRHPIERRGRPGVPIRIEVLESNPAGRAFCQALGFAPYAATMARQPPDD